MARIELAPGIGDDFDRVLEHLYQHEASDTPTRIEEVLRGISVLEFNPLIGRPTRADMREVVIGHQSREYVALYRYISEIDTVFVLAIRGQREAGYSSSGL